MVGKYHTRFKESIYVYIYKYIYICWISVSTCSQLGIFAFSFYTPCIPGYSAANDAHRSSTLRLSPAFSSSSAVKMRASKPVRSWHQLVSVKTRRVVYIHELEYKWKNKYIYILFNLYIYRYRLPMVVCWSYKICCKNTIHESIFFTLVKCQVWYASNCHHMMVFLKVMGRPGDSYSV